MSQDDFNKERLKPGESFRTRLTPDEIRARGAAARSGSRRATTIAEKSRRGVFPGSTAFLIGVLCLFVFAAINISSQATSAYVAESGEAPSVGVQFFILLLVEVSKVVFYSGLAALLAGAIRFGVASLSDRGSA
ncbi:MAG: hypothetical protein AB8F26_01335 [Phycisphaerales bacterium]